MKRDLFDEFARRLAEVDGQAHLLADWSGVVGLAAELAPSGPVAVSPRLASQQPQVVEALGDRAVVPSADDVFAGVLDAAIGIMLGDVLVAETGSVLSAEDELADRVVSMLAPALIQAAPADRLVASLEDAADWLAQRAGRPGYAALVTGPSRTADIERSLTIGIQGPATVHVAVLDTAPGS